MLDLGAAASGLLTGLREGVEAALIVSIVCAALVRTGNQRHIRTVGIGVVLAVATSAVAGVALYATIGGLPAPYEQVFEASAMLVAAAVVTGMLFWMRRRAASIAGRLGAAVAEAIGGTAAGGTAWGLALLAFTAVIREGLETALFLVGQAHAASTEAGTAGAASVLVGAVLGLIAATAAGYAIYRGSRRANLGRFFTWTGVLLVFVAAGLVSAATHELVEIGVIRVGTSVVVDLGGVLSQDGGLGLFLRALFGYSSQPEWIVLVAWTAYLLPALGLYLRPTVVRRAAARPAAPAA